MGIDESAIEELRRLRAQNQHLVAAIQYVGAKEIAERCPNGVRAKIAIAICGHMNDLFWHT